MCHVYIFFLFKQKTAYEMRISDWSSDVCSSDLLAEALWRLMPDTATEQGPMPDGLGERFEALFEANGDGGGHAACVVARHFPWIDHWFPEWTHRVIRPMLAVNHPLSEAVWHGFAVNPRWP